MAHTPIELVDAVARLGLALFVGSAIGFERQWYQKMAGLRTNALVALGACGFIVYSSMVGQGDPTRVAAQVVSGIGFLGAGVILREGSKCLASTPRQRCGARPWPVRLPAAASGLEPCRDRFCDRHEPPAETPGAADQPPRASLS